MTLTICTLIYVAISLVGSFSGWVVLFRLFAVERFAEPSLPLIQMTNGTSAFTRF